MEKQAGPISATFAVPLCVLCGRPLRLRFLTLQQDQSLTAKDAKGDRKGRKGNQTSPRSEPTRYTASRTARDISRASRTREREERSLQFSGMGMGRFAFEQGRRSPRKSGEGRRLPERAPRLAGAAWQSKVLALCQWDFGQGNQRRPAGQLHPTPISGQHPPERKSAAAEAGVRARPDRPGCAAGNSTTCVPSGR